MEISSADVANELRSPTLPLPPPKADQITMEEFIEGATRAVLRALASGLNPQPLPPRQGEGEGKPDATPALNPQPLPPITVGLMILPPQVEEARAKA